LFINAESASGYQVQFALNPGDVTVTRHLRSLSADSLWFVCEHNESRLRRLNIMPRIDLVLQRSEEFSEPANISTRNSVVYVAQHILRRLSRLNEK